MTFRLPSFCIAAAAAVALVSLGACSKSSTSPTPTPTATSTVSFNIDGAPVTSTSTSGSGIVAGRVTVTSAIGSRGSSLSLTMPSRTGTFTLPDSTSYVTSVVYTNADVSPTIQYTGTRGSISVSSYSASATRGSSSIAGTFTVTLHPITNSSLPDKSITNGSFNVKY